MDNGQSSSNQTNIESMVNKYFTVDHGLQQPPALRAAGRQAGAALTIKLHLLDETPL